MARRKRLTDEEESVVFDSIKEPLLNDILKHKKIELKFKNEKQKAFAQQIQEKEIVLSRGPAGCGKTFLACAQALKLFKENTKYSKIYLVKSVTTLKDEEIGFLKGTLEQKMEPFMFSFFHNIEKIIGKDILSKMREIGAIEVLPIAYLRGINLDSACVILDEAQNLTKDHLKTILTRIGTDCKLIILGDIEQIDMKNKNNSGFESVIESLISLDEIGITVFGEEDIVRNPLIKKILEALNKIF